MSGLTSKVLDVDTRDCCSELEAGALGGDQGLDGDGLLSMRHCARFGVVLDAVCCSCFSNLRFGLTERPGSRNYW